MSRVYNTVFLVILSNRRTLISEKVLIAYSIENNLSKIYFHLPVNEHKITNAKNLGHVDLFIAFQF